MYSGYHSKRRHTRDYEPLRLCDQYGLPPDIMMVGGTVHKYQEYA
jgi:hypothetical protein